MGGIGQLSKQDGTLTESDREAADVLTQRFFRTFTKEDSTNIPHVTPNNRTTETLTTFEVTEELVKKCLLQLKIDKSPGTDGIDPRILKEIAEQLYVPLNIIFNLSINTSTLPRQWKRTKLQASVPDMKVSVHGEQSNWCGVLSGITQGSVLGTVLFTIVVRGVPGIMNNLTYMFTDDSKLYAKLTDDTNSSNSLQEDLTKLQECSMKM